MHNAWTNTAEPLPTPLTHPPEIIRVLNEHGRMLERLPEAVREKIGFKG